MTTVDAIGNPVEVGDHIFYFYEWGTGHGSVDRINEYGEVIMRGGFMKSDHFVKVCSPE